MLIDFVLIVIEVDVLTIGKFLVDNLFLRGRVTTDADMVASVENDAEFGGIGHHGIVVFEVGDKFFILSEDPQSFQC
jgi:hypothetical protein